MRAFLAKSQLHTRQRLAHARVLLAFDFDGTLAPIVTDRDRAGMRPRTARLFTRVCQLYRCAVISGRARADLRPRLVGMRVKHVIGNHGLEPSSMLAEARRTTAKAKASLLLEIARWPGAEMEDKTYSLALHYRKAKKKEATRRALRAAVSRTPAAVRIVAGKMVLNVVPRDAPHKGEALLRLREREGAETVLYVGDDVTDEDVFRMQPRDELVGVRVGLRRSSAAEYYLRAQSEIDDLLAALIDLRGAGRP